MPCRLSRFVSLVLPLAVLAPMTLAFPTAALASRIKHPRAIFAGLDKITGRTIKFEAAAGETVQFGTLQITERACFTRPATEAPQTVTFLQVDEAGPGKQYKRIFSGWMFAASPGLHAIEHPIYDVWLTGCGGDGVLEAGLEAPQTATQALPPSGSEQAPQAAAPALPAKPSRRQRRAPPGENPAPPGGDLMDVQPVEESDAVPGGQPGGLPRPQRPGAAAPPLGQPVEVGPPPGFIPVPEGGDIAQDRRSEPVQRFYPIEPDEPPGEPGPDGD